MLGRCSYWRNHLDRPRRCLPAIVSPHLSRNYSQQVERRCVCLLDGHSSADYGFRPSNDSLDDRTYFSRLEVCNSRRAFWASMTGIRWSYWLNVILCMVSVVLFYFCYFPPSFRQLHEGKSRSRQVKELDYAGLVLFTGSLVALTLGFGR